MGKLREYDKEWLEELCQDSYSYAEVLKKAGRKQGGGSQQTLKKKIEEYQIDISHFKGQGWNKGLTKETDERVAKQAFSLEKYTIEDIFIKNSFTPRKIIRSYVIRHQLIPYQCCQCGCDGH